jgi:tetratricopeptide (TPR) repeat protein
MPFRRCFQWLAGLFGLAVLVAGCQTAAHRAAKAGDSEYPSEAEIRQRAKAHAYFTAGLVQEMNTNLVAAGEEFFRAAKTNPKDADLLQSVSARLMQIGQWARARDVLDWAVALPEADPMLWLQMGLVHAQLGQQDLAIAANRKAVQQMPQYFPARHNLYLSYVQARQATNAVVVLEEAARETPVEAEALLNLAELFTHCARQFPEVQDRARTQAVTVLDRVQPLAKESGAVQLKLAEGYLALGQTEAATAMYLLFLNTGRPVPPLRDVVRAKLADLYLRANDRTRAAEQLRAIVDDSPGNAGAHYFLGAIAVAEKNWEEAKQQFQRALRYDPDFEPAYHDLATTHLTLENPVEALATLETLRRRKPASFALEYLTALTHLEQKQPAQAVPYFLAAEKIAAAGPTNQLTANFYFQIGATLERSGDRVKAAEYFERALQLTPDHAEALNYLGYMWAEQGENLTRARELIERAVKLEPENEAFLDSMGWVLFQLGDYAGALKFMLLAVKHMVEPDATIYDHLGDVYAARNEMDQAREAWAKSLEIEPSEKVRLKLQKDPAVPSP